MAMRVFLEFSPSCGKLALPGISQPVDARSLIIADSFVRDDGAPEPIIMLDKVNAMNVPRMSRSSSVEIKFNAMTICGEARINFVNVIRL